MIIDLLAALATLALLLASYCVRPEHVTFPAGALNGVKPDGAYWLRRQNVSIDGDAQDGSVRGFVYCTNGATPLVVSYRVVGCQRVAP